MKATKVDGIYSADPARDANADAAAAVTYIEVLNRRLEVMDTTAISLCMDNKLPIVVFDLTRPGNIARIVLRRAGRLDRHLVGVSRRGGRAVEGSVNQEAVMQTVLKDVDARMNAALEALGREFATVRTGPRLDRAARRDPRRLLRHPDADQPDGVGVDAGRAHAGDPALGGRRRSAPSRRRSRSPTSG